MSNIYLENFEIVSCKAKAEIRKIVLHNWKPVRRYRHYASANPEIDKEMHLGDQAAVVLR